jgi:hypothetical protein
MPGKHGIMKSGAVSINTRPAQKSLDQHSGPHHELARCWDDPSSPRFNNHRLRSCENSQVRFTYRDRRNGDRQNIAALSANEFIRRFLLHVLCPVVFNEFGTTASCPMASGSSEWPNVGCCWVSNRLNCVNRYHKRPNGPRQAT